MVTKGDQSATDEVIVTVNNVIADAGEDVTINEGESTTLTARGGDSYLWSNGETTESIMVSPDSTTTYSVIVAKDGCEDIDYIEVVIQMETQTEVIANAGKDVSICHGEKVTLTASGGSTYEWSNGSKTKSITVSPTETKIYSVTVSKGSESDIDEIKVSLNNVIADAGSNVIINEGDSVTLTANGGESYLWSNGETTKSITISPESTKIFSVTAYKDGCEDTASIQVSVNKADKTSNLPAVADAGENITICVGESVILKANGGTSYTWSTGDTNENISVSPKRTTQYALIAERGGTTDTDTVIVTVENCRNIFTKGDLNINFDVFPNPSTGMVSININKFNSELSLVLINLNGSVVFSDKMSFIKEGYSKQIDLSRYAKGVYFIRLFNANRSMVKKILLI